MGSIESHFARQNVARLLSRYEFAYYKEDKCIEYFITDKTTNEQISYAIVFSLNRDSKDLHVSRFYPELYKQTESKYLSAACFYLLIHHFGNIYHFGKHYIISLDTLPATYKAFFSRLKDFDLRMKGLKYSKTAEVLGEYPLLKVDTSMIAKITTGIEEVPFRV